MQSNPFGSNVDFRHEQGFYEDGSGDNVGFFNSDDGSGEIRRDEDIGRYKFIPGHYNDDLMRETERMVNSGEYDFLKNNCQDYADKLRGAYDYLLCKRWGICSVWELM